MWLNSIYYALLVFFIHDSAYDKSPLHARAITFCITALPPMILLCIEIYLYGIYSEEYTSKIFVSYVTTVLLETYLATNSFISFFLFGIVSVVIYEHSLMVALLIVEFYIIRQIAHVKIPGKWLDYFGCLSSIFMTTYMMVFEKKQDPIYLVILVTSLLFFDSDLINERKETKLFLPFSQSCLVPNHIIHPPDYPPPVDNDCVKKQQERASPMECVESGKFYKEKNFSIIIDSQTQRKSSMELLKIIEPNNESIPAFVAKTPIDRAFSSVEAKRIAQLDDDLNNSIISVDEYAAHLRRLDYHFNAQAREEFLKQDENKLPPPPVDNVSDSDHVRLMQEISHMQNEISLLIRDNEANAYVLQVLEQTNNGQ
jgi:hypothetical protein